MLRLCKAFMTERLVRKASSTARSLDQKKKLVNSYCCLSWHCWIDVPGAFYQWLFYSKWPILVSNSKWHKDGAFNLNSCDERKGI